MQGGETTDCDTYSGTLTELRKRIKQQYSDNARPQSEDSRSSHKIWLHSVTQPHYGPDLAPSDVHLFGALTDAISDTKFGTNNTIRAVELDYVSRAGLGTDKAYTLFFSRSGQRLRGKTGYG
jgi:hypothetical protein